jgi:hypothetical protein
VSRSRNASATRQHWLLVRGTGDRPLAAQVDDTLLRGHYSSRRPTVQKGDLAVCYASVWQVIFAVAEVVGYPENDPGRSRWSWWFPIRPVVTLADLGSAPPVEEAGVFPRSLGRHSYIRLTPEQFETACAAIAGLGPGSAWREGPARHEAPGSG